MERQNQTFKQITDQIIKDKCDLQKKLNDSLRDLDLALKSFDEIYNKNKQFSNQIEEIEVKIG